MKVLIIILLLNFCSAQASGVSVFGLGDRLGNIDAASQGLGKSNFFTGNLNGISFSSPSSIWKTNLTCFNINSGMNFLDIPENRQLFHQSLSLFSVTFPIKKEMSIGFGIRPLYRTNKFKFSEDIIFFGEDKSNTGSPIAYEKLFQIDGGLSKLFFQYSSRINRQFSIGIEYAFLFGNFVLKESRYMYSVALESEGNISLSEYNYGDSIYYLNILDGELTNILKNKRIKSSEIIIEGSFKKQFWQLLLRGIINGQAEFFLNTSETTDGMQSIYDIVKMESAKFSSIGIGYNYFTNNNYGLILETHISKPFNISKEVLLFNIMPPSENSFHLGFYRNILNKNYGYWSNFSLRFGSYIKEINFVEYSNNYFDYGLTFGIGLELLSNSQFFDISLCAGKRGNPLFEGESEKYIGIHLGLTTGEKWFLKRRRK